MYVVARGQGIDSIGIYSNLKEAPVEVSRVSGALWQKVAIEDDGWDIICSSHQHQWELRTPRSPTQGTHHNHLPQHVILFCKNRKITYVMTAVHELFQWTNLSEWFLHFLHWKQGHINRRFTPCKLPKMLQAQPPPCSHTPKTHLICDVTLPQPHLALPSNLFICCNNIFILDLPLHLINTLWASIIWSQTTTAAIDAEAR